MIPVFVTFEEYNCGRSITQQSAIAWIITYISVEVLVLATVLSQSLISEVELPKPSKRGWMYANNLDSVFGVYACALWQNIVILWLKYYCVWLKYP